MPGPKPPEIVLTKEEQTHLERLVRARTTGQQLATRGRIVLLAAEGLSTEEIARRLRLDVDTARQWRARWCVSAGTPLAERGVAERLADAPKSGRPARITPEPALGGPDHRAGLRASSRLRPPDQPVERPGTRR